MMLSFRVVFCQLDVSFTKTPYLTMTTLLMELMEFQYNTPHQERENILLKTFKDRFILDNLPLLNELLHLKVCSSVIPSSTVQLRHTNSTYLQLAVKKQHTDLDQKARIKLMNKLLFSIVAEVNSCTVHASTY